MAKISAKIMNLQFSKKLKQLIIAALCVAVLGGGLSAFLLKDQIGEAITGVQLWHENQNACAKTENAAAESRKAFKEQHCKENFLKNLNITEPSAAAKITLGVTALLGVLAAAIYWLLIAAWLYKAAELSGMHGFLWFLLGLGANLFAAIFFCLVRSFLRKKCPSCGHYASRAANYCTECGGALIKKCTECGTFAGMNDKFCSACGKQLPKQ